MSQVAADSADDADSAMDVVSMSKSQQIEAHRFPVSATTLAELRQPYPVPNLQRMWQQPHASFDGEQLKSAMVELTSLQRYAKARAVKLHKHLVEVANATNTPLQLGKWLSWVLHRFNACM